MSTLKGSLCRIADLDDAELRSLSREQWETGDYVAVELSARPRPHHFVELSSGRAAIPDEGDLVYGALGVRAATLEATGSWEAVGDDGALHLLTNAGLIGKMESLNPYVSGPPEAVYRGHLVRDGQKLTMGQFVPEAPEAPFDMPVLLIVGSSMSAGKTASARVLIRRLVAMGHKVVGAKLTGAGRYRDAQSMLDAGACEIFDFVDAGMPSTVVPGELFVERTKGLLRRIQATGADLAVIEAGASPLEPYNGAAAMELLDEHVVFMVLCASDPYSVVGITQAFERQPDLVSGIACSTHAGAALVEKLTGLRALHLVGAGHTPDLDGMLQALGLPTLDGPCGE